MLLPLQTGGPTLRVPPAQPTQSGTPSRFQDLDETVRETQEVRRENLMQTRQKSNGPVVIGLMDRESGPLLRPSSNEMDCLLGIEEKGYHKKAHEKIVPTKQRVSKPVAT